MTTRDRIVTSAARLLAEGGRDAVTTRAVEAAAGVQAPTIYRLFGDKQGLVEAVAEHELAEFMAAKAAAAGDDLDRDPVDVLRDAWRANVQFGLDHPALYALMHGDPGTGDRWAALELGMSILRARVRRIAAAGRLRVSEERAVAMVLASGRGTVLTLIGTPAGQRDLGLLDDALDALIAAITTEAPAAPASGTASAASALRASLGSEPAGLSPGERALLDELLVRLAG